MNVLLKPLNQAVEAQRGETLLRAAARAGVLIDGSCAGYGKCGKCKVKLLSGTSGPLTEAEDRCLTPFERERGYRLACELIITSDLEVLLPGYHCGSTRKKDMSRLPEGFQPCGDISIQSCRVAKPTMRRQLCDLERISEALGLADIKAPVSLLTRLHDTLEETKGNVTLVRRGSELIDIRPVEKTESLFGIAFDIGTTTVVGMLWDLIHNTLVDVEAKTNYQSLYGADVISRIQFCIEERAHLLTMREKVVACMNDILEDIYVRNHISPADVCDVTMVGNTTMSHLAFQVTPRPMSRTPFAPVFRAAQTMKAEGLGLGVNPRANVYLLPNIAGHVGSDIVAMMLAVGFDTLEGGHIAIDIGTNGEVVAKKDGRMVCCSTAAGPAFEGGTIRNGMRAAPGAIERVRIDGEQLTVKSIDDASPIGICGSGLIDAVASLLTAGVIEKNGRMLHIEEAVARRIPTRLAKRITTLDNAPAFLLARGEDGNEIFLTQQDVREVQLAKGAILAGILTLMKNLSLSIEQIDSIMLAGAFGNYIDKESALRIGMLPQVPIETIISIGNSAGTGASMALLSTVERLRASNISVRTEHIELSTNMDFQEFYVDAMRFDTDIKFKTTNE